MKFRPAFIVLAIATALVSVSQASVVTDLARMRATYTTELAKIEKASEDAVLSWREQYTTSLRTLEQYYQKAGQLEPLIEVQKETRRFIQDKMIDDLSITNTFPDLYRVQKSFATTGKALPADREKRIAQLKSRYDKTLQTLQENLTRQGDVDGALTVKNTRDMLQRSPEEVVDPEAALGGEQSPSGTNTSTPPVPAVQEPAQPAGGEKVVIESWTQAEARILARFNDLCTKLQRQEESVVALVDPVYVSKQGAKATRMRLRYLFAHLIAADSSARMQTSLKGSVAERHATLVPFVMTGSVKKELPAMDWVCVDGEWYVKLGGAGVR